MRTKAAKLPNGRRSAKSRSGCKGCKIKCDEAVPSCQQCIKRKSLCPGYAQTLTWSSRHERFTQEIGTVIPSATKTTRVRSDAAFVVHPSLDQGTTGLSTSRPSRETAASLTLDLSSEPSRAGHDSCEETHAHATSQGLGNSQDPNEDLLHFPSQYDEVDLQACLSPPRNICLDYWKPSPTTDLVLCSPAVELHYFNETICRHLFVCDAGDNPMRNITVARVRQSALYHSLLKYLTAEYFNICVVAEEAQCTLQITKADTEFHLQQAWRDAAISGAPEEVLLATMMFGLAASWDGANRTGAYYYRQALTMYHQLVECKTRQDRLFYDHALMYWRTGLAFVMESSQETLPESPAPTFPGSDNAPIDIHPLVGISPQSHRLMGEVGALVYSQRRLALRHNFISLAKVREQKRMMHRSQELEQALLAMQIPEPDDLIHRQSGDDTPAVDLYNMAEAYRLCAILLLYRCFPDLLLRAMRLKSETDQNPSDRFLSARAIEALKVIERNRVTSRTKSVEQLLLLIIAGELTLPNQEDELATSPFDQESPRSDLNLIDDITAETKEILTARALVCTRMSAIRNILPYRSVEQAEELMWDVWWRGDNGEQAFWMDVMIERGLRFVMV